MTGARFHISGEDAQVAFGAALAAALKPGMIVFLNGELGAGKTTLVRGIARALGHGGAVKSPTYTLVEPYDALRIPLYHFDLYRLGDARELEYLGISDYFHDGSLVLVEWAEHGYGALPGADLVLDIEVAGTGRDIGLRAASGGGVAVCEMMRESCAEAVVP